MNPMTSGFDPGSTATPVFRISEDRPGAGGTPFPETQR